MKTLLLSGWAQPPEALSHLAPQADSYDYTHHATPEEAIDALARFRDHDAVIGWSLGGQLALRALAAGALKPRRLTLIAAPARFVGTGGMGQETFGLFRESYARDPARTKERFHALVAKGDQRVREVMEALEHHPDVGNTDRFLPWLNALEHFDAATLDLAEAPPTLIFHGMNDHVVPYAQGEILSRLLPRAILYGRAGVGHAPHLSEPDRLRAEIAAHHGVI